MIKTGRLFRNAECGMRNGGGGAGIELPAMLKFNFLDGNAEIESICCVSCGCGCDPALPDRRFNADDSELQGINRIWTIRNNQGPVRGGGGGGGGRLFPSGMIPDE